MLDTVDYLIKCWKYRTRDLICSTQIYRAPKTSACYEHWILIITPQSIKLNEKLPSNTTTYLNANFLTNGWEDPARVICGLCVFLSYHTYACVLILTHLLFYYQVFWFKVKKKYILLVQLNFTLGGILPFLTHMTHISIAVQSLD